MSMNRLTKEKRASILRALVEGCSVNSVVRMTGASKVTILKLLLDIGRACNNHEDKALRNLVCQRVEADEIWGFIHAKDRNLSPKLLGRPGFGSQWTWYAIDADSKLIVSWMMGDRDASHASAFMDDLASRLAIRPQLTTDALGAYADAVANAFDWLGVDYAQVHKSYGRNPAEPESRYSPAQCTGCEKRRVSGHPNRALATTSHVERANLTLRMSQRRWTRLTNAHSKSFRHMEAAFALHAFHYNWVRAHSTIKTTPAVAAGIAEKPWTMEDLIGLLESQEAAG